jgi:hypothetical protein
MQFGLSNVIGILLLFAYYKIMNGKQSKGAFLVFAPFALWFVYMLAHIIKNVTFSALFNRSILRIFDVPFVLGRETLVAIVIASLVVVVFWWDML